MRDLPRHGSSVAVVVLLLWISVGCRPASATTCEAIRIPMCRSMPYNVTQIPNLLHHSNQLNALLVLEQYQPLVTTNCSDVLLFFLCSLFTPLCPINFSQEVIPPCRDVCLRAKGGCEPVLASYNHSWPQDLSCDDLPPYETGVCISPEAIVSNPIKKGRMLLKRKVKPLGAPGVQDNTNTNDCPNLSKLLSGKNNERKRFQFAIRLTLMKVQTIAKGQITLSIEIKEIFRSSVHLAVNDTVPVISSLKSIKRRGQCGGSLRSLDAYRLGKDYLMMGHRRPGTDRATGLVCFSDCIVQPWKNSFRKGIQRWKERQQKKKTDTTRNLVTTTLPPKRRFGQRKMSPKQGLR